MHMVCHPMHVNCSRVTSKTVINESRLVHAEVDGQHYQKKFLRGPFLDPCFSIFFINDLYFSIPDHCKFYNYADDNTVSCHDKHLPVVKVTLEDAATRASTWFESNLMQANPSKFQAIILCNCVDKNTSFTVSGVDVPVEHSVKLLGVHIDDKLKFDVHISELCRKTSYQLNALSRLSKHLSYQGRLNVYNAYILSNFNYCGIVWHFCDQVNTLKLEKLAKRALRVISNDHNASYDDLLQRSGRQPLYISRLRSIAIETYKCVNKLGPPFLHDHFVRKNSSYSLHGNQRLDQPKVDTTTYGLNSFRYQGAKILNQLPSDLKKAISLNEFKSLIKTWTGPLCQCQSCTTCKVKLV